MNDCRNLYHCHMKGRPLFFISRCIFTFCLLRLKCKTLIWMRKISDVCGRSLATIKVWKFLQKFYLLKPKLPMMTKLGDFLQTKLNFQIFLNEKSNFLVTYNVNVANKIVIAVRQRLRPILTPHLLIIHVLSELSLAFNIRSPANIYWNLPWDMSCTLYAF